MYGHVGQPINYSLMNEAYEMEHNIQCRVKIDRLSSRDSFDTDAVCIFCLNVIGHIQGAIVAATSQSDHSGATIATRSPRVYTTDDRRGDNCQFVVRLNRCSSPRQSPVVYTRGDCRGNLHGDDCRDSSLMYTLQAIVVAVSSPR